MKIDLDDELKENDEEYTKGLLPFTNIIEQNSDSPPNIYNPAQFQENVIIKFLQNDKVIKDRNICPKCGELMNKLMHKPSIDNLIWRCHKRSNPHDAKINIRSGSVFEDFQRFSN